LLKGEIWALQLYNAPAHPVCPRSTHQFPRIPSGSRHPSLPTAISANPAAIIILQTILFRNTSLALYKFGYLGALVSYSIVILKSLGKPQVNIQWVQRAFVDENVQYAVLALYWFVSKPVNGELYTPDVGWRGGERGWRGRGRRRGGLKARLGRGCEDVRVGLGRQFEGIWMGRAGQWERRSWVEIAYRRQDRADAWVYGRSAVSGLGG
jgi:hypothetical protein